MKPICPYCKKNFRKKRTNVFCKTCGNKICLRKSKQERIKHLYSELPCSYCGSPRLKAFPNCGKEKCKELAIKDSKIYSEFRFSREDNKRRSKNRGILTEFGKKVIRDDYKPPE